MSSFIPHPSSLIPHPSSLIPSLLAVFSEEMLETLQKLRPPESVHVISTGNDLDLEVAQPSLEVIDALLKGIDFSNQA